MTSSLTSVAGIAAGVVMLLVSSLILTVTIEEIGRRGKFSERFTGAIISPVFTAMPELVVIIVALVLVGKGSGSEIATGTIIGEPFMVSAIGFPIVALTLLAASRRRKNDEINPLLSKTLIYMGLIFPIMLIPFFFNLLAVRVVVAVILVLLYVVFFRLVGRKESFEEEATEIRIRNGALLAIMVLAGIAFLLAGSTVLVRGINNLYLQTGINQELITILLVPIGTIVPETMNSVLWAARGKTSLAIGAMAGEEMYFATFFPALGILASRWYITTNGIVAVLLTSVFSIVIGMLVCRFRKASYVFIFFIISLIAFLIFVY